jgi:hypothetical protein
MADELADSFCFADAFSIVGTVLAAVLPTRALGVTAAAAPPGCDGQQETCCG